MMKPINIIEAFPETLSNQFDFKGVYTDREGNDHNLTVFDTAYFISEIAHNYFSRWIILDKTDPKTDLINLFTIWKNSRLAMYLKQAYAYTLKYNPVENYASHEVMTNDITTHQHGEVITTAHGRTITATDNNRTKTTTPADSTEFYREGIGSNAFVPTEKETHSGTVTEVESGSTTNAESGSTSDTHTGTDTDTHNYTLDKTGNIGVATAAEMLQREYDGLMQDLARRCLFEFLDRYTYEIEVIDI